MSGGQDATYPGISTPAVTQYAYDVLDNLTQVVQSGSRQRTYAYSSLSQLTSAANPESGAIAYAYDPDGNVSTKTAPKQNQTNPAVIVTTTFAYDELHRLKQKSYNDGSTPTVSYGYDGIAPTGCTPTLASANPIGRRTAMCDAAGWEAWSYEIVSGVGWRTTDRRTTNGITKDFVYQNNLAGSLATLTYPTNRVITYGYNAAAQAVSAVDVANSINYALNASYAPHGAVAAVLHGQAGGFGGITASYGYNARLQPTTMVATSANGTVLDFAYNFSYGMANNGNVAAITNNRNPDRSQSFTYDELNRVKTARTQATTGPYCWGESFYYDIWANLVSIGGIQPEYNGCTQENLSVSVNAQNQVSGNTYDAAGNLTADGSFTFQWDAESRMKSLNGGSLSYTYDGDGRRVKKSNGKLYWYGGGSEVLAESDLAGNITDEYVFFGGKRIARRIVSSGEINFNFADHLGSSRVVTGATGTILDDADFYSFGGERVVASSSGNTYKFTGKERDSESGNDYAIFRSYINRFGRFSSTDPIAGKLEDPQSLNRFAYVASDPINLVDPLGLTMVQHCFINGVEVSCGMAFGFADVGMAMPGPFRDFLVNPATGDVFVWRHYVDGSSGWRLGYEAGWSLNDIEGFKAEIKKAQEGTPIDPNNLTPKQKKVYDSLKALGIVTSPGDLKIYALGKDRFFGVLSPEAYQRMQNLVGGKLSSSGDSSFFHFPFTTDHRQMVPQDSLELFYIPLEISRRISGGDSVFAGFDIDRYNPIFRPFRHAFCDVLRLCR